MLFFPVRHCAVKSIEYSADLFNSGFGKSAAVLPIKLLNLCAGKLHMGETAAGIQPKLPAFDRISRRVNRRALRLNFGVWLPAVLFCRRDTYFLGVAFP